MDGRRPNLAPNDSPPTALKLTFVPDRSSIRPPAWDERDPAVRVLRNPDGAVWAYSYADGSERWMCLPGIASFRFGSRGEEAAVVLESSELKRTTIEDAYQRAVLPMALHAHGGEAIHASAVITDDGVVGFCGRSQTGKSTVAHGLHRRGYRVWADDTLVFEVAGDAVQAIPYPHRLRIRPEAAEYFNLAELRRRDTSNWDELELAQHHPAPLACLFLLEREAGLAVPVETIRLTPSDALLGVVEHSYWFRLDSDERKRLMIERYLALAARVPVFRLRFRAALEQLPAMLDVAESAARAAVREP